MITATRTKHRGDTFERLSSRLVWGLLMILLLGGAPATTAPRLYAAPAPCAEATVRDIVEDFFDALNRGDLERVARVFPMPSEALNYHHSWFGVGSSGELDAFFTIDQRRFLEYVGQRHSVGEVLSLQAVATEANAAPDGHALVRVDMTRQADDLPAHAAVGRGMVDCGGATMSWLSLTQPGQPVLIIDGERQSAPQCGPDATAAFVASFVSAYNHGDEAALGRMFPPLALGDAAQDPNSFRRYAVSAGDESIGGVDYRWTHGDNLLDHFAQRRAAGDHWEILHLELEGDGVQAGWWATVLWTSHDLVTRVGRGKGAIACQSQQMTLWNMSDGVHPEDDVTS